MEACCRPSARLSPVLTEAKIKLFVLIGAYSIPWLKDVLLLTTLHRALPNSSSILKHNQCFLNNSQPWKLYRKINYLLIQIPVCARCSAIIHHPGKIQTNLRLRKRIEPTAPWVSSALLSTAWKVALSAMDWICSAVGKNPKNSAICFTLAVRFWKQHSERETCNRLPLKKELPTWDVHCHHL